MIDDWKPISLFEFDQFPSQRSQYSYVFYRENKRIQIIREYLFSYFSRKNTNAFLSRTILFKKVLSEGLNKLEIKTPGEEIFDTLEVLNIPEV